MGLRPGRTVRKIERPYTRVSKRVPRKSYVVGVPFPKIHQFEMGTKNADYNLTLYLVVKNSVQIRHNALEAARIVSGKFLEKSLGTNYFLKILHFPHHVVRIKPIATGAGADRYSQGMRQSFGQPEGTAVQIKSGENLIMLKIHKEHLEIGKIALRKFGLKIPTPIKIVIEE
jgi:large subunit ribosomal protein L10e